MSELRRNREQAARMLHMANQFYQQVESPNEEEIESIFVCLLMRNEARLSVIIKNYGIQLEETE